MLKFLIVVFKILLIIGAIGSFIAEFEKATLKEQESTEE